jgi:glycosyltransferase involved in cell wall biosynthesis
MGHYSLSYVLPVHNDEKTVAANVARLAERLRHYRHSEILLVENGSSDESWKECAKLAGVQDDVPVHAFREPNAGIGYAYARGLTGSDIPWGFSDLDSAKVLLAGDRAPVVIGSKAHPESVAFAGWKRYGMSLAFRILRRAIVGMRTGDSQGSFFIRLDVAVPLAHRVVSRDFFYTTELVYFAEALPDGVVEVSAIIEPSQLVPGVTSVRAWKHGKAMFRQLIALRSRGRER